MRRHRLDSGVDLQPICDDRADDAAGQIARAGVRLDGREVALQDRHGRALAEVRLEHGRQGDAAPRPQ